MNEEQVGKKGKYKILLVEDQQNIIKLFTYNLSKAGFYCEAAKNGKVGLERAKLYKPDLIISDIMMPEVDGIEFRKMLLKDTDLKSIPFVFLTAKGEEEDILEGYGLGIEDYIIKSSSTKVIIAKVSAILQSIEKEKKKIVEEIHRAANSVGAKVIPDKFPEFKGFDIKHWHVPFKNIPGGDFIDYFKLDDNTLAVVLGDVMGKKWGAWYFAVAYAGYVRSAVRFVLQSAQNLSPGEIVKRINESICKDERLAEIFITISVLILDAKNNNAKYSGAGDLPLIFKRGSVEKIQSGGLLMGFDRNSKYEDRDIKLQKGDTLFLITDGLIESRGYKNTPLGIDGFIEILSKIKMDEDPLKKIKREVHAFTGENFEDDLSIVIVQSL